MFPWVLWAALENSLNLRRRSWDLSSYGWLVRSKRTSWTCSWHLQCGWRSCRTGSLTCGVWYYLRVDNWEMSSTVAQLVVQNCLACHTSAVRSAAVWWWLLRVWGGQGVGRDPKHFLFILDFLTPGYTLNHRDFSVFCFRSDGYGEQTSTSVCLSPWNAWNKMLVILPIIESQPFSWQITVSQTTFNERWCWFSNVQTVSPGKSSGLIQCDLILCWDKNSPPPTAGPAEMKNTHTPWNLVPDEWLWGMPNSQAGGDKRGRDLCRRCSGCIVLMVQGDVISGIILLSDSKTGFNLGRIMPLNRFHFCFLSFAKIQLILRLCLPSAGGDRETSKIWSFHSRGLQ